MMTERMIEQRRKFLRDRGAVTNALKAHLYGLSSPLPLKEVLAFAAAHLENNDEMLRL